jgi:hypothetical protein
MFNGIASYAALKREIDALKSEVKALRNQQIKKNRDMEDLLFNLDSDNVPTLDGVVKRVNLIVGGDGTAKAEFIIEAINGSSEAKIKADVINLQGTTFNLTADNMKIESDHFRVDADGNMECGNAKIRGSSTICSDITPGAEDEVAMAIGPEIEFDMGESKTVSGTKMRVTDNEDVLGGASYTRGVAFVSTIDRNIGSEARKTIHGGVVSDPRIAGAFMSSDESHTMRPDYDQAFVGLERPAIENDGIRAILRVGEHALWLDAFGVLRTTASEIVFEDEL